ncbi:phage tail sheath family protein [Dyella tabacisoli]
MLSTPASFTHSGGNPADKIDVLNAFVPDPPAAAADITTLAAPGNSVSAGSSLLFVAAPGNFLTAGDLVRITDGSHTELRRIGHLGSLPLATPAYAPYLAGAVVEECTVADDIYGNRSVTVAAAAGDTTLTLDKRQGLSVSDVLRIGLAADPLHELIEVAAIANHLGGVDPGVVTLSAPLQRAWATTTQVRAQVVTRTTTPAATLSMAAASGDATLIISDFSGLSATSVLRISASGDQYFHTLSAAPAALNAQPVTLNAPLNLMHAAGEQVIARTPLLTVRALDQGAWGNRLRVAVIDNDPPLAKTSIRSIQDNQHLRLISANGIEAGTVLLRVDAAGHTLSTHKVIKVDRQSDSLITLDAATPLPGTAAVADRVVSQEFQLNVYLLRQPDPAVPTRSETILTVEAFPYLSMDPRHSRYVHKVIGTTWVIGAAPPLDDDGQPLRKSDRRSEGESWLIRIRDEQSDLSKKQAVRLGPTPLTDTLPSGAKQPARLSLTGGDDAVATVNDTTYIGQDDVEPELRTGLYSLRNEEEISIVAAPGRTGAALQGAVIAHCENMLYRFAVLDGPPPPDDQLTDVQTLRQQFDSKYAAIYHPWLVIPNPYPVNLSSIADYPVPPSGHVIGVYARVDNERGVHKAPANEIVRGITGLRRRLHKGEQDILNPYPVNINVIRDFRGDSRGLRVYGARVITSDPDWKYVNVRRLLIFIESSLNRGLQWVVFEPNAEPLWAQVRRSISNFLTQVWRSGALEGTKVEEAFFVRCDRTTMTQTDIDNGRLICLIGVAPVKPAEFVIVRIGLWTATATD